jgi:hypothetical protein
MVVVSRSRARRSNGTGVNEGPDARRQRTPRAALRWRNATIFAILLLYSCEKAADPAPASVAAARPALIRDEAHEGRAGFHFLPPLTAQPSFTGHFEARLAPEVHIDRVTAQGAFSKNIATFTAGAENTSQRVLRNLPGQYYVIRWRSIGNLNYHDLFRLRVLAGDKELGFAEIDLVSTQAQFRNVNTDTAVPLLVGDTLAIKFRIEQHAVDLDQDGVFDWLDNCPEVPNPASSLEPREGQFAELPLPAGCDSNQTACDPNEQPCNPARFVQPDADGDGVGDACDCEAPNAVHCGQAGAGAAAGPDGSAADAGADPQGRPAAGVGGSIGAAGAGAAGDGAAGDGAAGDGAAGDGAAGDGAAGDGAAGDGAAGEAGHPGNHGAHGPHIARAAIPSGDPGVSRVQVRATQERPAESDGVGAFRTVCAFSHMNFDDPIVAPGKVGAAHLHAYFGNTGADAFSTARSLRESGNSTCRGGIANRTAYWVPALVDQQGNPQTPGAAEIYYKTGYRGIEPSAITGFPAGLRIIAGDARASSEQANAWWGCDGRYIGRSPTIPECPEGDRIVMTVVFPQCWDGVNLDSDDHKRHMAYPQHGRCPTSHPVAVPEITFNIPYAVANGSSSRLRLASDTYDDALPPGYSAHADWFDAWDPAVMQAWVKGCDAAGLDCHSHLLGDGRELY